MDSKELVETRKKGVLSSLALRFCTVKVFPVISCFFLSLIVGILVFFLRWGSSFSSASLPSRCKIVSSTVDLRSSKVCSIGLLNIKTKHMFYPFERDKFLCRYDYYWASIFKVEYKDHFLGQRRLAYSEAPNEALPLQCRPNFGAVWLTKVNFEVNETYNCTYSLGIPNIKLYPDSFFGCRATNDPSSTEILKQYDFLFAKLLKSWASGEDRPKYRRSDVVVGIISGFSTSMLAFFLARILQHVKSRVPQGFYSTRRIFHVNLLVPLKRMCFIVVYFSVVGWMAMQYLKLLNFPPSELHWRLPFSSLSEESHDLS